MIFLGSHGHCFLLTKNEAFHTFKRLAKVIQNETNLCIASIRSDHGWEFENEAFETFFDEHGIEHNFLAPITLKQNGVVERQKLFFRKKNGKNYAQ